MEPEVTCVADIAKRSKVVLLQDWRTTSGNPVGVLCEEVPGEQAFPLLGVNPGERPKLGIDDGDTPEQQKAAHDRLLKAAPGFIELGTSLRAPDGSRVSPAFYFPGGPRHELSLDGSRLSETDLLTVTAEIMRLSGCLGAAAEASFLRRGGDGVVHVAGAVALLQGHGDDPAAGPA